MPGFRHSGDDFIIIVGRRFKESGRHRSRICFDAYFGHQAEDIIRPMPLSLPEDATPLHFYFHAMRIHYFIFIAFAFTQRLPYTA